MSEQRLVRPRSGRVIAGVCGGIARRYGWDPTIVRIVTVVSMIVIPGSQILIYPLLWLIIPGDENA